MSTYVLIIMFATSFSAKSGSAGISQEFNSYTTCKVAGDKIAKQITDGSNHVMSIGCYQK